MALESWDITAPLKPAPTVLPQEPVKEKIQGTVESILHYSEEDGFTVFRLRSGFYASVATGITARLREGESAECVGRWENHREHGRQFKADQVTISPPDSLDALKTYLCSGAIKGVGEHFAQQLLSAFGGKIFDVLDETPEKIGALPGIGKKRL